MLWLLVAAGGALGAMARYGVSVYLPPEPGKFPMATFSANVLGSLLIGVFYVVIVQKGVLPIASRYLIMVGFLGAFTTFSTFSLESIQLLQGGYTGIALAYIVSSLVLSIVAVFFAVSVASKIF